MSTLPRIGIYARVSSDDQAERGTIESQIEFATKYCDLHQLPITAWYKDDGITGTVPLEDRAAGVQLLQDAQNGVIDTLLLYKLDRFGRNARIILNGIHALEKLGVKVKSMTEPFDTSDPAGRFTLTILAGVADLERENILARMWHGANRAARAGKWLGGIVPYGYYVDADGFLAISDEPIAGIDTSEADVIRLMYRMLAEQQASCSKVADALNTMGIPPKYIILGRKQKSRGKRSAVTSGQWTPGRIRNTIVETTYKGVHHYGRRSVKRRETIEREVPAIVDVDTWDAAQRTLRHNQLNSVQIVKVPYLLRGYVFCGQCGLRYVGTTFKEKRYYVCGGKQSFRGPLNGKCQSKNMNAEALEDYVWSRCVHLIRNPEQVIDSSQTQDGKIAELQKMIAAAKTSVAKADEETQNILTLFRRGHIPQAAVELQLDAIGNERAQALRTIAEMESAIKSMQSEDKRAQRAVRSLKLMQQMIDVDDLTWDNKRSIIDMLISKVIITTKIPPGGTRPEAYISIKYAIQLSEQEDALLFDTDFKVVTETLIRADNHLDNIYSFSNDSEHSMEPYLPPPTTCGNRIRRTRILRGMLITELAERIGFSTTSISKWENGRIDPHIHSLKPIAEALDVTVQYLGDFEGMPEDTFIMKLNKARCYHGHTWEDTATAINVDRRAISEWIAGRRTANRISQEKASLYIKILP